MVRILCDHCQKLISDPRKAFIFAAEKYGARLTDTELERVELPEQAFYSNDNKYYSVTHKQAQIYCSECMMDLWAYLEKYADGFKKESSK